MTKGKNLQSREVLSGVFSSVSFPNLITFLEMNEQSGMLEIRATKHRIGRFYFENGMMVGSSRLLSGVPSRKSTKTAEDAERKHLNLTEELVFYYLTTSPESYALFDMAKCPSGSKHSPITVQALLLEVARRVDEWKLLPPAFQSPDTFFEIKTNLYETNTAMQFAEWSMLHLAREYRRLSRIWEESPLGSRLKTSSTLFGLSSAGLIRPLSKQRELPRQTVKSARAKNLDTDQTGTLMLENISEIARGIRRDTTETVCETLDQEDINAGDQIDGSPVLDAVAPIDSISEEVQEEDTYVVDVSQIEEIVKTMAGPPVGAPKETPTQAPTENPSEVQARGYILELGSETEVIRHELEKSTTTLGRLDDNDIVLGHEAVSKCHAAISKRGNYFELQDLSSGNGVWINGKRVSKVLLAKSDEIMIVPFRLRFGMELRMSEAGDG